MFLHLSAISQFAFVCFESVSRKLYADELYLMIEVGLKTLRDSNFIL